MKFLLLISSFFFSALSFGQNHLYDIRLQSVKDKIINMVDYKGRKIMIASLSPDNLQNGQLAFFDSIAVQNPLIKVIIIPANDFNGNNDSSIMTGIKNDTTRHAVSIAAASLVKKANGNNQNKLMQWLTSIDQNIHFNADVETDNQLYLISPSGILYAVLAKGIPVSTVDQLIKQDDVKQ